MNNTKFILLDIDGVMVPAASWKQVEMLSDGFYKFNNKAERYLDWLLKKTGATIILTTSHKSKYTEFEWKKIFDRRFSHLKDIQTLNTPLPRNNRLEEVLDWANIYGQNKQYVIIDDDSSLYSLPPNVKRHWVKTQSMIGLNRESVEKAFEILNE